MEAMFSFKIIVLTLNGKMRLLLATWLLSGLLRASRLNSALRLFSNLNRSNGSMILQGQNKISDKQRNQYLVSVL